MGENDDNFIMAPCIILVNFSGGGWGQLDEMKMRRKRARDAIKGQFSSEIFYYNVSCSMISNWIAEMEGKKQELHRCK